MKIAAVCQRAGGRPYGEALIILWAFLLFSLVKTGMTVCFYHTVDGRRLFNVPSIHVAGLRCPSPHSASLDCIGVEFMRFNGKEIDFWKYL